MGQPSSADEIKALIGQLVASRQQCNIIPQQLISQLGIQGGVRDIARLCELEITGDRLWVFYEQVCKWNVMKMHLYLKNDRALHLLSTVEAANKE